MDRVFIKLGSFMAFLAVLVGAFGAHALPETITGKRLDAFHTGSQYQMYHALGLILVGLCIDRLGDSKNVRTAGWLLFVGILFFSGSLYAYSLTGNKKFGMLAPLGGTSFMVGWILLAVSAWKTPPRGSQQ